jgi:hypothetical protein
MAKPPEKQRDNRVIKKQGECGRTGWCDLRLISESTFRLTASCNKNTLHRVLRLGAQARRSSLREDAVAMSQQGDGYVLVHAPFGRDAILICQFLAEVGISTSVCTTLEDLCSAVQEKSGAALISDQSLTRANVSALAAALENQPMVGFPSDSLRQAEGFRFRSWNRLRRKLLRGWPVSGAAKKQAHIC